MKNVASLTSHLIVSAHAEVDQVIIISTIFDIETLTLLRPRSRSRRCIKPSFSQSCVDVLLLHLMSDACSRTGPCIFRYVLLFCAHMRHYHRCPSTLFVFIVFTAIVGQRKEEELVEKRESLCVHTWCKARVYYCCCPCYNGKHYRQDYKWQGS
jgi:hypothetical protein